MFEHQAIHKCTWHRATICQRSMIDFVAGSSDQRPYVLESQMYRCTDVRGCQTDLVNPNKLGGWRYCRASQGGRRIWVDHVHSLHCSDGCWELWSDGQCCLSWWQLKNPLMDNCSEGGCHAEEGGLLGLVGPGFFWSSRQVPGSQKGWPGEKKACSGAPEPGYEVLCGGSRVGRLRGSPSDLCLLLKTCSRMSQNLQRKKTEIKLSCSLEGCHCGQLSCFHCLPPEHHEGIQSPLQVLWGHVKCSLLSYP